MQTDQSQLPVRGTDAIEILINDHEVIKGLLERLTAATQDPERRSILEQLKGALTLHNATEENLLYPALNKVAGKKSEAEKLYHETAEADVLVFELDTMLKEGDTGKFQAKAEKLQDAVLEHIDDEESSAFPHLQKGAEPAQSQMLTQSVREFRSALRYMGGPEAGGARSKSETGEIGERLRGGQVSRSESGAGE